MTEPSQETCFMDGACSSIPNMKRFTHEAMATTFEVIVVTQDAQYAQQAARAAFDQVDRLERDLSRFIENSDISRINALAADTPAIVGLETFECLQLAQKLYHETNGLFDITIGSLFKCWKDGKGNPRIPTEQELEAAIQHTGVDLLQFNESEHTVCVSVAPLYVDLGGIGKGYAVDCMAKMLQEWDINIALIHGGYSSVLALDPPPDMDGWPLTFTHPQEKKIIARLSLSNRAVSGSGVQKGGHIIDPRTAKPVKARLAAWSSTPDAASGDALSTTFMMMSVEQIKAFCSSHPDVMAALILRPDETESESENEQLLHFGKWNGVAEFQ